MNRLMGREYDWVLEGAPEIVSRDHTISENADRCQKTYFNATTSTCKQLY